MPDVTMENTRWPDGTTVKAYQAAQALERRDHGRGPVGLTEVATATSVAGTVTFSALAAGRYLGHGTVGGRHVWAEFHSHAA